MTGVLGVKGLLIDAAIIGVGAVALIIALGVIIGLRLARR